MMRIDPRYVPVIWLLFPSFTLWQPSFSQTSGTLHTDRNKWPYKDRIRGDPSENEMEYLCSARGRESIWKISGPVEGVKTNHKDHNLL
jgi:hypothetical protein